MSAEGWRPVPGFPGYEVSSLGRVISHKGRAPRLLRTGNNGAGYRGVCLRREGRTVHRLVHHLVAEAFHGPRPLGLHIRHLNGQRTDNTAANLRYGTASDNMRDAVRHGVHANASKAHCPAGHPYSPENTCIDSSSGGRRCRTCRNAQRRAYRALARAS